MKRIISIICVLLIAASAFSACSAKPEKQEENGKLSVVTTIFPIYDWAKNIAGDDVHLDLKLLLSNGVDLHNYQPSADDIITISTCDIFIYVGGESDKWVEDTLKSAQNKDMVTVNLMELLGESAKKEEIVEGMQGEEKEDESESETEYDEHIWLSLKNAKTLVDEISKVFADRDSGDAQYFHDNAKAYSEKLDALDKSYQQAVDASATKTLLFGDRFPFRYMTEDYGLDYFAAFAGCSAESEASFETISFLSNKVDELNLKCVITIDGGDGKIANTIIENTKTKDQKVITLNSMQSVTENDIKNGQDYLSIMQSNLEALQKALN